MLPELQTERLILRELARDDAEALHNYQSRPVHWAKMAIEAEEFSDPMFRVEKYLEHRGEDPQRYIFAYAARLKTDDTLIGQVSLSRFHHPKIGSVGFGVDDEQSGKGYATEIVLRIIRYGFQDIGLHRISAEIAVENVASRRVAEKAMLQFEGVARGCIFARNRWWDEAQYAALKSDQKSFQNDGYALETERDVDGFDLDPPN